MNVKFVTLCTIWTLGGQIYGLDALRPTKIDCVVSDKEGLDESFMRLSKSGRISLSNPSVDGPDVKIEEQLVFSAH